MALEIQALVGMEEIEFIKSLNYTSFYTDFDIIRKEKSVLRDSMQPPDGPLLLYKTAIFNLVKAAEPSLVVELGVREGYSSDSILRAMGSINNDKTKLVSFDPDTSKIKRAMFVSSLLSYWDVHEMTGEEGYERFGDQIADIDLLYIDTEPHSYEVTKAWLEKYWINNVRPGGYIMVDDCAPQHQKVVPHPRVGVIDFGVEYGVLEALLDFFDNNDRIDFAFSICNTESNGIALIKFKE
jgi:predicted O-methyltransferase YrrM